MSMTPRRILLVEDEAFITLLLEEVLTELGHEVCAVAATEAGAVSSARIHKPDLMIVDMRLAEGNGASAIRKIHSTGFIPYILMSGDLLSFPETDLATVTLRKPFQESELVRAMDVALDPARGRPMLGSDM